MIEDDGRPRISWKADSSFFAISSLELSPAAADLDTEKKDALRWNRVLRVFTRIGALSSTSEADIRGVSQALAYKPIGNIIATTQRFGKGTFEEGEGGETVQWAAGRNGRHDVIFYERNGLRHGGFGLREESGAQPEGMIFLKEHTARLEQDSGEQNLTKPWQRRHAILELAWNIDGTALAVVIQRGGEGSPSQKLVDSCLIVQIWTTGNYHWYLKQEIRVQDGGDGSAGLPGSLIRWHPENPMELYIAASRKVHHYTFAPDTAATLDAPPLDTACVAVADGVATLLTPFRLQNVPPPMSSMAISVPESSQRQGSATSVPVHYAWASVPPPAGSPQHSSHVLALLSADGRVEIISFDWGVMGRHVPIGGRPVAVPRRKACIKFHDKLPSDVTVLQVAVSASRTTSDPSADPTIDVVVFGMRDSNVAFCSTARVSGDLVDLSGSDLPQQSSAITRGRIVSSKGSPSFFLLETELEEDGTPRSSLFNHSDEEPRDLPDSVPSFCNEIVLLSSQPFQAAGLAANGRLYLNRKVLATGVNSFTIAGNFLVWTNNTHEARLLPLSALESADSMPVGELTTLSRAVERGSRIVTAIPSEMSLVLQMPRGNLETINPRPLVLEVVRRDLDKKRYRSALRVCRAHRLDLNLLHDHKPDDFMADLALFVKQVGDVDHLNLFLTGLKDEDVTMTLYKAYGKGEEQDSGASVEGKTNRICTALRVELEREDSAKYLHSILTSYVKQSPPDYEGALALLRALKGECSSRDAFAWRLTPDLPQMRTRMLQRRPSSTSSSWRTPRPCTMLRWACMTLR